jgi:hypothetical protein
VGKSRFKPLHHAQAPLNGIAPRTPAPPLVGQGLCHESGIDVASTIGPFLTQSAPPQIGA